MCLLCFQIEFINIVHYILFGCCPQWFRVMELYNGPKWHPIFFINPNLCLAVVSLCIKILTPPKMMSHIRLQSIIQQCINAVAGPHTHIHDLCRIKHLVPSNAVASSHVDYCNSLCSWSKPWSCKSSLQYLQRIQKSSSSHNEDTDRNMIN